MNSAAEAMAVTQLLIAPDSRRAVPADLAGVVAWKADAMFIGSDLDALEAACRKLPLTENTYIATDLVNTLLETVLDYQMHTTTASVGGH